MLQDCLRRIFGDATTVASLLSARDSYSWTLLMVAACANAERVVGFLLEFEIVDFIPKDRAGNTAIDLASKKGHRVPEILHLIAQRAQKINLSN